MPDTALLVIDAQVNMFDPANPAFETDRMLRILNDLIARARTASVPVIFIRNNGGPDDPDRPHTPGWEIEPRLNPQPAEAIVDKSQNDSFADTTLQALLTERQIHNLVICGLQTDYCVNATTRRAASLGYSVTLVSDGHSTYDGPTQTAAQTISQYNTDLAQLVVVLPASAIQFH